MYLTRRGFFVFGVKAAALTILAWITDFFPQRVFAQVSPEDQQLSFLWRDPAQRASVISAALRSAQKDRTFRIELIRWVASEEAVAMARHDQASLDAFESLGLQLQNLPDMANTLRQLVIDESNERVRTKALALLTDYLKGHPTLVSTVVSEDMADALLASTAHDALADNALAVLQQLANEDPTQRQDLLLNLAMAAELARARGDEKSGLRIESVLRQAPFSEPQLVFRAFRLTGQDSPTVPPLLRHLAAIGVFPHVEEHGVAFQRIMEAAHWPHLRKTDFEILDSASLNPADVLPVTRLYLDLERIGRALDNPNVVSAATGRLDATSGTPDGIVSLLSMAGKVTENYPRALAALRAAASQSIVYSILPDSFTLDEHVPMLLDALRDPNRMDFAETILTALKDRLTPAQKDEWAKRTAAEPMLKRRHDHLLDNLRRLIVDPNAELSPDLDDLEHPNMNQYVRQYLTDSLDKDYRDLIELLLMESDPQIKVVLILTMARAANFRVLVSDWDALRLLLRVIEDPMILGSLSDDDAREVRRAAAYIIGQSIIEDPFFIETARLVLKLKDTIKSVPPPAWAPTMPLEEVKVDQDGVAMRGNLLDRILDHLSSRDVLEAYLESNDDGVRNQALSRLETSKDVGLLLESRPDAIPALIKDLRNSSRGKTADDLLGRIQDVQVQRYANEQLMLIDPSYWSGNAEPLRTVASIIHDERAVQACLSELGRVTGQRLLGNSALQQTLRLLGTAEGRKGAAAVLLAWPVSTAARSSVIGAVLDEIELATARNESQARTFYIDLFTNLSKGQDYADVLVSIWKEGFHHRHRVAALHRIADWNADDLRKIPAIQEVLQRSLHDPLMAEDAAAILKKRNLRAAARAEPPTSFAAGWVVLLVSLGFPFHRNSNHAHGAETIASAA